MVNYKKHTLPNGLTLLLHEDKATPLVCVNTLVRVGARDEHPQHTGFAHLFEHLMFGGTERVPDYDAVVNAAGGDSNAFTNNDYTNYYLTLPVQYLESALWIESDRMRQLAFSPKRLQVQRQVVTEEYHQRYENQPYGDVWLLLRPLCYKVHPYRWPTIGSTIEHVQQATIDEVRSFFSHYYRPNNAIMAIAGNMEAERTAAAVEKWFGDIPAGEPVMHQLPAEPPQEGPRELTVRRNVPADAVYICYHMPGRLDVDFPAYDLLSDLLGDGDSSRLCRRLVKEKALFTEIDACVTGDWDPGLFVVSGKLRDGVEPRRAVEAVEAELQEMATAAVPAAELQKVKVKGESTFAFAQYKAMDRAMELCYYEAIGHAEWVNDEPKLYATVDEEDVRRVAANCFRPENRNVLYYMRQIS